MTETPPLNRENMKALVASLEKAAEQAREAIQANSPRVVAAFEQMRRAMLNVKP